MDSQNELAANPVSILVVDDDDTFRSRLSQSFTARGHTTFQARTCEEAIALSSSISISRAVVDLRLAERSGLEVVQRIREVSPATQVVMLTGYGSIATAIEATKRGAVNYLSKPANAEEILAAFAPNAALIDPAPSGGHPAPSLARAEWEHIQRVLADCQGNITHAADCLGIPRRSLQRKLAKFPPKT